MKESLVNIHNSSQANNDHEIKYNTHSIRYVLKLTKYFINLSMCETTYIVNIKE